MQFLGKILVLALLLTVFTASNAQFGRIRKFNYSILENKTLFLPTYEASQKFVKKMARKGEFEKIMEAENLAKAYNKVWEEAMEESSYDASPYEIKAFDYKELLKEKNEEAILLYYYRDNNNNWFATLKVAGPKRITIASALINGLNILDKKDIRLMMNMLNESLNTFAEIEEDGERKSLKTLRNKYKENLITFYDNINDKVFLVPESEDPKRGLSRTADLRDALKEWELSNYEITTHEEIQERIAENDSSSFYWKEIPIYQGILTFHYNLILSTKGDDVIFGFMGTKRLKGKTIEEIQGKIAKKVEKYRRQLYVSR